MTSGDHGVQRDDTGKAIDTTRYEAETRWAGWLTTSALRQRWPRQRH